MFIKSELAPTAQGGWGGANPSPRCRYVQASGGRVGRRSGLKKQKDRPKAAANDDDDPFLPHLFFQCRIVHEVSADFFRTPTPQGAGATSGALGVDTYGLLTGRFHRLGKGDDHDSPANLFGRLHRDRNVASTKGGGFVGTNPTALRSVVDASFTSSVVHRDLYGSAVGRNH